MFARASNSIYWASCELFKVPGTSQSGVDGVTTVKAHASQLNELKANISSGVINNRVDILCADL